MVQGNRRYCGLMHKSSLIIFMVIVNLALLTPLAYAYVNPGLGGQFFQIGFVFFYLILGCLIFLFRPIMRFFKKKDKTKVKKEEK